MKILFKTIAYRAHNETIGIESITYSILLWAFYCPRNSETLIESISCSGLLYYYGFPLKVHIMTLYKPEIFLDTPPPIIQNKCRITN